MAGKSKVSEFEDEVLVAEAPYQSSGNGKYGAESQNGAESAAEEVDELVGTGDFTGSESFGVSGEEALDESAEADNHKPLSSPPASFSPSVKVEAEDSESFYESLPGFDESARIEAAPESAEPLIEAYYAEADGGNQEFFQFLLPVLKPLITSILPTVIGAVAKQGSKSLSPHLQQLLARLQRLGLRPGLIRRETGEANGMVDEVDEAMAEAMQQQLEALEVVIGRDDRVRVNNTKVVPWNRICHLSITAANGSHFLGTGFLIGRRTVITAGHCVHMASAGGWVRQIIVTPGRNAGAKPFGTYTSSSFRSVKGWVVNKNSNYDYGAIIMPQSTPATLSAFGFANYADAALLNKRLNNAGYPGDKPAGTMWYNANKCKAVTPRTLIYDIDTMGGQSGSPIWIRRDGKRTVVGIHTNGAASGNSATRITHPVFLNLKRWRTEGGV